MKIVHPNNQELLTKRNHLIQTTMRPENLPFAVTLEYPIILKPSNHIYSYCMVHEQEIIAHANLWPRQLVSRQKDRKISIALVGNVTTALEWRGRGLMKVLFQYLREQAQLQGYEALFLWSNLTEFYQKLGFEPLSTELRFYFNQTTLSKLEFNKLALQPTLPDQLSDDVLTLLLSLRKPVSLTVERNTHEFRELLQIPFTDLFLLKQNSEISGYMIVGKGFDMCGVIHEWGYIDQKQFVQTLISLPFFYNFPEMILLTPPGIDPTLKAQLQFYSDRLESHHMALGNILNDELIIQETLSRTFIWGLDSI